VENKPKRRRTAVWPVYIALMMLLGFGAIFVSEFVDLSQGGRGADELAADTYMDIVEPLLANADSERGPDLLQKHGCNACHSGDVAGRLAPELDGLGAAAGQRRPPLTAEAYIYEAIIYPGAHIVEGFHDNMPRIYQQQIPQDELGDIIAYLLTR
jgi:cytochrome c